GAARGRGRPRGRRPGHRLVGDPDAALRPPRADQGAGAARLARPRRRLLERRRVRRQERSIQSRDRGGENGSEARPPGQGHPHPRGGLPLPPRAPPRAHGREDRDQADTRRPSVDHGAAPAHGPRRRRLRQLRRGLDLLHRRAADGDLQDAGVRVPGGARLHQQASVRPEARPRHAAAPFRLRGPSRQDRGEDGDQSGGPASRHARRAGHGHGQLAARRHHGAWAVHRGRGRRERLPRALGPASRGARPGARLRLYWNHMPQSGVMIKLDRSGGVAVFCGEAEIGQGSDSVLAATVAEILGVSLSDIRLCVADTDLTPVDLGSYSSRVTLMVGNAAIQAAERARELIAKAAGEQIEVPAGRLVFAEGRVFDAADPDTGLSFSEAVIAAEARFGTLATTGSYIPPRSPGKYRGAGVGPSPAYSYSAAVIEVEVDSETGLWNPLHVWIAHDVGKCINPVLVLGQVEGSVYMGLGEVMMEESAFRRLPRHLSNALVHKFPSMLEYKSPTFDDMPPVTSYLIEDPDPQGPFGAKEVGQGPLLPVMPAVANAIWDAVGVRIDQSPIHPHMILKALQAKAKGEEPRFGPKAFPEVDFGETLLVPTPEQGGDGKAINDYKEKLRGGMRSASGTMMSREEALRKKKVSVLTTELKGAR